MVTVAGHYNSMFKFIVDGFLDLCLFWCFTSISLFFLRESDHLFVDQLKTVVDRKILTDVVDNKIDSTLENPRACEESGPCLNSVVKNFGL